MTSDTVTRCGNIQRRKKGDEESQRNMEAARLQGVSIRIEDCFLVRPDRRNGCEPCRGIAVKSLKLLWGNVLWPKGWATVA